MTQPCYLRIPLLTATETKLLPSLTWTSYIAPLPHPELEFGSQGSKKKHNLKTHTPKPWKSQRPHYLLRLKAVLGYLWKRMDFTKVTTSRLALYPAHTIATWMSCAETQDVIRTDPHHHHHHNSPQQALSSFLSFPRAGYARVAAVAILNAESPGPSWSSHLGLPTLLQTDDKLKVLSWKHYRQKTNHSRAKKSNQHKPAP